MSAFQLVGFMRRARLLAEATTRTDSIEGLVAFTTAKGSSESGFHFFNLETRWGIIFEGLFI
jgi:hypothetical protein